MCVGHHYTQIHTNNIDKTQALLQTTGSQNEPNIVFMWIKQCSYFSGEECQKTGEIFKPNRPQQRQNYSDTEITTEADDSAHGEKETEDLDDLYPGITREICLNYHKT
jgi:hypothetical protein